jgi:hypothetical protein
MDAPITMRGLPDLRATGERRHPPQQAIAMPITTSAARWPDRTLLTSSGGYPKRPECEAFPEEDGERKEGVERGARVFISVGLAQRLSRLQWLRYLSAAQQFGKMDRVQLRARALGATASPCQGGPRNTHRALVPSIPLGITISRTHLMKPSNPLNMSLCLAAHRVNCCSAVTA